MNLTQKSNPAFELSTSSVSHRQNTRFLSRALCWLALIVGGLAPVATRAQVSISINVYYNTYPGQSSYYIQIPITTSNTPATYDEVISPQNDFASMLQSNGDIDNDTYVILTQFSQLANALTNGTWQFITDVGAPSQKSYTFNVTATGFTSNLMPAFQVTYPMPEQTISNPNVNFTWSGDPTFYTALGLTVYNGNAFFEGVGIDPFYYSSWTFNKPLTGSDPDFYFEVNYETSATNYLTISTPVTSGGQPISGWSATSTLNLTENNSTDANPDGVHFILATNQSSSTGGGHTNLAYYSFEDDSLYAHDYSGNNNDIMNYSYFGPYPYITNDAEAGFYACAFAGYGWLNPPTNLVTTLSQSFSVSIWAKTTADPDNDTDTADNGAGLLAANTDQVIPMAQTGSKLAFLTGGNVPDTLHSTNSINTGTYTHLVVTRDQDSGEKKIYINGALDSSDIGASGTLTSESDPSLYLGENTSFAYGFVGIMDEVQIYSGVLSASEVSYLYSHPGTAVSNTIGLDFNGALNTTNLPWITSGDASWFVESTNTVDGLAAQSGSVTNNQLSTLSVTVAGPGTLTFYWSCIANDPNQGFYEEFYLDGDPNNNLFDSISGDTSWYQDGPFTIPAGSHTLNWTVFANGDTDPTEAGFLDEVSYNSNAAPVITESPLSQTNYSGYPVWLFANATGEPAPTWQWYEVGVGAIPGATSPYYMPTNSGAASVAGSYYAVAGNSVSSATTATAVVSFVSAPLPPDWAAAIKSPFYAEYSTNLIDDLYGGCAVDALGNIYVADEYVGSVNIANAASNYAILNTLQTAGFNGAAALVKNDPNGHVIWGVGLTNNNPASFSYALATAIAPSNGAYLSSVLIGTNWLGATRYANSGTDSILLSRFDANGSNIWSKLLGQTNTVFTTYNDLVSDSSGNVTLGGLFNDTLNLGGTNILSSAGQSGFLAQYDSNGIVRWTQVLSGYPQSMVGNSGTIFVSFNAANSGNVTNLSIGSLSNVTDRAYGLAAVNSATGQPIWQRGVGEQYGADTSSVIDDIPLVSLSGTDVFLIGTAYGSTATFGSLTVPITGGRSQYFARYDTNGNALVATNFGSATTWPWAATANASGVYTSGDFDDFSYFGQYLIGAPEYSPSFLGSNYFTQPFVAKFDRNGNSLWALNGVSPVLGNFRGIATAPTGIWASGFLDVASTLAPAQFGANTVFSDGYIYDYGAGITFIFTPGGLLAKINESSAPAGVTLLNPKTVGGNFQFQFESPSGVTNNILYTTNLASGRWLTNSAVVGNGTLQTISIPLSTFSPSQAGFVRVSSE